MTEYIIGYWEYLWRLFFSDL